MIRRVIVDSKYLTARLLLGQRNLDLMKKAIKEIVSSITGLLREYARVDENKLKETKETSERTNFRGDSFSWWVSCYTAKTGAICQVIISGFDVRGGRPEEEETHVFNGVFDSSENRMRLSYEHIQLVSKDLHLLVGGLVDKYPAINKGLQPLIDASHEDMDVLI